MPFVYSITHRDSGRQYVGMTAREAEQRWYEHRQDAKRAKTHFQKALRGYGHEAFDFRVEAELPTREEALIAERILVALRRPDFNMTPGGDGMSGEAASEANRKAWASGKRARTLSAETRAKMSAAHKGLRHTPESIEKMRRVQKALAAAGNTAAMHAAKGACGRPPGFKHSAETRAKMSAAAKRRTRQDA